MWLLIRLSPPSFLLLFNVISSFLSEAFIYSFFLSLCTLIRYRVLFVTYLLLVLNPKHCTIGLSVKCNVWSMHKRIPFSVDSVSCSEEITREGTCGDYHAYYYNNSEVLLGAIIHRPDAPHYHYHTYYHYHCFAPVLMIPVCDQSWLLWCI